MGQISQVDTWIFENDCHIRPSQKKTTKLQIKKLKISKMMAFPYMHPLHI
jgi:hypothetical protein